MASPASYGSLSFEQQLAYMRRKLPSVNYQTVTKEAHDTAFVVAGANRADLVNDIYLVLQKAMREGATLDSFREDFYAVLDHFGWQPEGGRDWRSRVIYETNLRTSYAAGRWTQIQAVKKVRPYLKYLHSESVLTPRPLHLSWNGLVIHVDDPWWQTHYPPNGWGCQCGVEALSLRDLKKLGKDAPDIPPQERLVTVTYQGRQTEVPEGIDAGWDYAPGRSQFEQQIQNALVKNSNLPAAPAASMNQQLLANKAVDTALHNDWQRFINASLTDDVPRRRQMVIGTISPEQIARMQGLGVIAQTAAIDVTDKTLLHIMRQTKAVKTTAAGKAIAIDTTALTLLPTMLANPQAVLLDKAYEYLVYIYPHPEREAVKLVVKVNFNEKVKTPTGRQTLQTNHLRTATLVDLVDIKKDIGKTLELIEGKL